jgi:hypothetical protein
MSSSALSWDIWSAVNSSVYSVEARLSDYSAMMLIVMRKVHVTQDDHGFWFISLEEPDGTMKVVAHHYVSSGPAIADAQEFIREEAPTAGAHPEFLGGSTAPKIVMVVEPPRRGLLEESSTQEYTRPEPRKADE